ncbi:MAG TPA: divalent-cation tolerance protein CutA [Thermoanaerobaculia bacterium]|nr:divalent-cation tolerance protein CutA [Thermoanaerobaculia bacterium]
MNATVVITTVGNEEQANTLARELVARRQAACVNILPGLKSFYRWQGKVCHDTELMLVIKTRDSEFEAVAATIRELHNYELPEILSFGVGRGEERFLAWIAESTDKSAPFGDDEEDDEPAFASDED